jgi:hypothetical protein
MGQTDFFFTQRLHLGSAPGILNKSPIEEITEFTRATRDDLQIAAQTCYKVMVSCKEW